MQLLSAGAGAETLALALAVAVGLLGVGQLLRLNASWARAEQQTLRAVTLVMDI
jgi:hypothetical protein